ncbi:Phenylalanine ammonia-lyase [Mycena venus]|uniref:Phenylalanine ammonia-lyase n=1 Tax=Mycena venus TaxID=2733690 RepID=A0A8H6X4U6_9AGAR|nr:Phenylalanine ammonia-lyase [Mycena venus]
MAMGPNNSNGTHTVPSTSLRNGVLNGLVTNKTHATAKLSTAGTLLTQFLAAHNELEVYRNGEPIIVDGQTLSIAAVTAASRELGVNVALSTDKAIQERVRKSRDVINQKVERGVSVYGISTGFGGSADSRTDKPLHLGLALLQHQVSGILPSAQEPQSILPLLDPGSATTMPEAWVRGAMLIRMNSLIRGHSGVRFQLIEKIHEVLRANVIPVVPLRGSISASGDLSPLSYVAGLLIGNPSIRAFDGPPAFGSRKMVSSRAALSAHKIEPISLASKEHLGILNGTAFSTSVAALALNDAVHLTLLAQVCTALVARPHPGQVECAQNIWNMLDGSKLAQTHEKEVSIYIDKYLLRQDRYPLRTSPQFLGPQIEDILSALSAVTQECNSTTDNPLVDGDTGEIHHGRSHSFVVRWKRGLILSQGGNFQAMAVTNAMEKTRLALHHIGKLLFAQMAELLNPAQNRGLPPSLALTNPSLNYFAKAVDIAAAAYVSELGYLANPVSTHIQSAELHNQAVNSLALISARATIQSLDVLTMLTASCLYILCQAVDIRALQDEFGTRLCKIVREELHESFGKAYADNTTLLHDICAIFRGSIERTSNMDAADQMDEVAASSSTVLLKFFTTEYAGSSATAISAIPAFQLRVAERGTTLLQLLRSAFLAGERGASPASTYLGKTKAVYEFVRLMLGIKLHGVENQSGFANGLGVDDITIGQNISFIYEAIRDGKTQGVIVRLKVIEFGGLGPGPFVGLILADMVPQSSGLAVQ